MALVPLKPTISLSTEEFVESLRRELIGKSVSEVELDGDFYRITIGDRKLYIDHRIDALYMVSPKDK